MMHRVQKNTDFHLGKWNGLGGKLEPGETFLEAAVREFLEESGCITIPSQWIWAGQLYFPNFKPHKNEDWWVNVWTIQLNLQQKESIILHDVHHQEGLLTWIKKDAVINLNLWDGDRYFLPYMLNGQCFQGTLFYTSVQGEHRCTRHEILTYKNQRIDNS